MSTSGTNVSRRTAFIHDLRLTVNCLGVDGLVLYLQSAPDDSNLDSALLTKLADLLKMLVEEQELEYSRLAAPMTLDEDTGDARREQPYAVVGESKGSDDDGTSPHDSTYTYQMGVDGDENVYDPANDEWPIVDVSEEAFPELFPTKEVTKKKKLPKSFPNLEEFRGGIRLLGSGNFGLTFKSVLKGVPVVLKVSKKRSEEANRADYHEWSVSERLNPHQNVLQISGLCPSFENPLFANIGTTALIAPLKENGGLREFFDNRKERYNDIMDMAFGMIAGIRSLHEQRVVHRDIAVRNFLVDCDGRVLLCDFGLTEFIPEGGDVYHGPSAEVLPWRNLAPESFHRIFSPKSDIWMYGLALVELLSKKHPWSGVRTCAELRISFEEKNITLPNMAGFPPIIAEIVRDCLQFNPQNRPSADDIAERLVKWKFRRDEDTRDENGNTKLHRDVANISILTIESNVKKDVPMMINGVNAQGETPLMLAMLAKYERMQRTLLSYGKVPSCNSEPSRIPEYFHNIDVLGSLLKLAQNEDVEGIKSLGRLGLHDFATQMQDKGGIRKGVTPLHIAAKTGNTVLLNVLINLDLFDHRKVNSDGQTALHVASIHGHAGVIEKLLSLQDSFESKEDVGIEVSHEASKSHLVNVQDNAGKTALHLAAQYGNLSATNTLLDLKQTSVNIADKNGQSPIFASFSEASTNQQTQVAVFQRFLDHSSVDINEIDSKGETILHSIARKGNASAARILLDRKDMRVSVRQHEHGYTPLHLATRELYGEVVKVLLSRDDVNINEPDKYGNSPLHLLAKSAALSGDMEDGESSLRREEGRDIALMFLERNEVAINKAAGLFKRTPLHEAVIRNNMIVLKQLVAHSDIDVNKKDRYGETPLYTAACVRCVDAAKLLLENINIQPNAYTNFQSTPLHIAAKYDCVEIANLLLSREDVDVEARDQHGETPLHRAAGSDSVKVGKLLLSRDDVNADARNQMQQTPLHNTARWDSVELAIMLLARDDVDASGRNADQQTPLHMAARWGSVNVAKLLLSRDDVDASARDSKQATPLHLIANEDYVKVGKLLLLRDDVDINARDNMQKTPLHRAAYLGCVEVAKLLLARNDVDADARDKHQQTPLYWAASFSAGVTKLIISRNDINIHARDVSMRTPLHVAAHRNNVEAVKLLLARQNVEADARDTNQETPLHYAAFSYKKKDDVAKLLLARNDVSVNAPGKDLKTPLHYAAERNNVEVAKLLLSQKDVTAEACDVNGMTAVHTAAAKGSTDVAEVILATNGVDVNARDKEQRTALHHAALGDHHKVAKLLLSIADVDVDARNLEGNSSLDVAKEGGASACVALLEKFIADNAHS